MEQFILMGDNEIRQIPVQKAYKNRIVLHKEMTDIGFIDYPCEKEHYSYGDKDRAYITDA